jgi:hypothetical protein
MDLDQLRATLDEDERVALYAGGTYAAEWRATPTDSARWEIELAGEDELYLDPEREAPAEHIARHDPARVLRWVRAAREILAEIERELADDPTNETAKWLLSQLASVYGDADGQ